MKSTQETAVAVPQEALDGWRSACHRAHQYALAVGSHVLRSEWREANQKAGVVAETLRRMGMGMDQAGAVRSDAMPPVPAVPAALRDTPASRRYLDALREAHAAALDMDAERYGSREDGPAAGMIELLLSETREEVFGPVGRVRE